MKQITCAVVAAVIAATASMVFTSHAGAIAVCFGQTATIVGSGTINGTPGNDVIVGSIGNDVIKGNGGNDIICAESGVDTVNGNSGNDLIFGGPAADKLAGDAGDDIIFGDADSTAIRAAPARIPAWEGYIPSVPEGCDSEQPGWGADRLLGGGGDDQLLDFCGNNAADGGTGADIVDVSGTAKGGAGDDEYVSAINGFYDLGTYAALADGGSGNDLFVFVYGGKAVGGSGNDEVYAGSNGSVAEGGSGNDKVADYLTVLTGGSYDVTLDGGAGRDLCITTGDDVLISCERIEGNV